MAHSGQRETKSQSQNQNQSEIARLRELIEREHQLACFARTGLHVGAAQHRFITRRMDRIGDYQERLASLIGEQAANEQIIQIMEQSPAQNQNWEREGGPHARKHRP